MRIEEYIQEWRPVKQIRLGQFRVLVIYKWIRILLIRTYSVLVNWVENRNHGLIRNKIGHLDFNPLS